MLGTRIAYALDRGVLSLPDAGTVAVFGARAGDGIESPDALGALPRERLAVVTGFRPDWEHFEAQGIPVALAPPEAPALAIVRVPRARAAARGLIAQAAAAGPGGLLVDGQKTDGIDAVLRECRAAGEVGEVVAKAHGKIFAFAPGNLPGWADEARTVEGGFVTRAGLFSADGPDPGSVALAAALPDDLKGEAADLGAGWGYLARRILERPGLARLHLVEAEHAALECARANVTDPRAAFHWADATRWQAPPLDHVMTNPPFHAGRVPDPALGRAFIAAAARLLKPSGTLWLVANRHLPYEAALAAAFGEVATREVGAFKLVRARRPSRPRRPDRGRR